MLVNKLCQLARGLSAALWLDALPVEVVVKGLRRIVEQAFLRRGMSLSQDCYHVFVFQRCALDEIVCVVHILSASTIIKLQHQTEDKPWRDVCHDEIVASFRLCEAPMNRTDKAEAAA